MDKELFQSAQRILTERLRWEEKVRRYKIMRHDGLPRRDKTKDWQADSHSKTIDRAIRRSKPFWIGQLNAGNRLCNFTALTEQVEELTSSAADFYDFHTRNKTNLITELNTAVDHMLLTGRGIIKSCVDPLDEYKIVDESVDPMFMLMPESCNDFEDADEWIHIRLMTVPAYKRLDQRWDTSAETIGKIRGTKEFQSIGIYQQQTQLREGITHTTNSNYVLIFEHWRKTASGHDISYYSPNCPEVCLRETHPNPYKSCPFNSFQMEIKDKGWYSPRGLGEMLDIQEQYETFIENRWADAMVIANTRIFTGAKEIQNMANLRLSDGQYIPGSVSSVQMAPPPMPWEQMLQFQRGRSEEISQVPQSSSTDSGSKTGGKAVTATEASIMNNIGQVGMNYAAEIFRRDLMRVHKHRWGLIVEYKERDFAFVAKARIRKLEQQVLHDKYLIEADGSPEGWNPQVRLQREVGLMQTFAQLPNSNADYWVHRAMLAVDGQAAMQGFKGLGMKQMDEYEAQANEIQLLTATPPFPVQPQPQQDQETRIKCIVDWLMASHKMGIPVDPIARKSIQTHLGQRVQLLQQQNPAAAGEVKKMLTQLEQEVTQPAQSQPMQPGQDLGI